MFVAQLQSSPPATHRGPFRSCRYQRKGPGRARDKATGQCLHTAVALASRSKLPRPAPLKHRESARKDPGPAARCAARSPATAKVASAATVASNGASGVVAAKAPTRQVSEQPSAVTCGISAEPPAMRADRLPSAVKSTTPVTATPRYRVAAPVRAQILPPPRRHSDCQHTLRCSRRQAR